MARPTLAKAIKKTTLPSIDPAEQLDRQLALLQGDWRGYLHKHKSLFDAHSKSVYSR